VFPEYSKKYRDRDFLRKKSVEKFAVEDSQSLNLNSQGSTLAGFEHSSINIFLSPGHVS